MKDLVSHGKRDFRVRTLAAQLTRKCAAKDYLCYAQQIFEYCRDQIQYVFDPNGVELIEAPHKIIESGVADCDSIVVLLAAMLESVGFPCEFVTIKADSNRPQSYSHVYLRCRVPKSGWVKMDATMHDKPFGWGPPEHYEKKFWPASNDASERREGDRMAGNNGNVPHVEYAKGQVVDPLWQFRPESALIVADPADYEMQPLDGKPKGLPETQITNEFFAASQAQDLFDVEPELEVKTAPPATPGNQIQDVTQDKVKTVLTLGAVFLGALFVLGKLK